ncbi:TlpA disulfide reductase family protein [Pedobacter gandavensis]|uniref:Redoxin domain-containing protein n=1 Tax=Pedobacter gandavensis TaxID=2679963 RepID=A0ABR6EPZ4_9SPHI|nr:TlpA disulfide reductase family protein [Pedobacter gandavensis]MBB2147323.1 redoxin domain-containing protein [Pedobacter gandavensis]
MKKLLIAALLPISAYAQTNTYNIEGKSPGKNNNKWVYLSKPQKTDPDSVRIKNGRFNFKGSIAEPMQVKVYIKDPEAKFKNNPGYRGISFFLENNAIELKIADSIQYSLVKGSVAEDQYNNFKKATKSKSDEYMVYLEKFWDMGSLDKLDTVRINYEDRKDLVKQQYYQKYIDYVIANPSSPICMRLLKEYQEFNHDAVLMKTAFDVLPSSTKAWPSAKAFSKKLEVALNLSPGQMAKDFKVKDKDGKWVNFSEIPDFKGKYVLIDFWASWCGPCRSEMPNVLDAYKKYKDAGLVVMAVSVDETKDKDKCIAAIKADGTQDLYQAFDEERIAADLYDIQSIPQNYLIDPSGKIIAKNIKGIHLSRKMRELFPAI